MSRLQLFSTAGCHLCDLALEQIKTLPADAHIELQIIEIGDEDNLIDQYGTKIPVIRFADDSELNWPFSQTEILQKLALDNVEL